jgi:hypothetical protein
MLGDGKGGFQALAGSPFPTGAGPTRVAIGDVDGDGVPEVIVSNYSSHSISILRRDRDSFALSATIPVGKYPDGIAVGDLDGDGKADIVVANSEDNNISILFGK